MLWMSLLFVYFFAILITYSLCKLSEEADRAFEEMRLRDIFNELQDNELQDSKHIAENLV